MQIVSALGNRPLPKEAHADLPKDPTVLRTIVRKAGQHRDIYASTIHPGRVAVGAVVESRYVTYRARRATPRWASEPCVTRPTVVQRRCKRGRKP
jgi:hypothetical protein